MAEGRQLTAAAAAGLAVVAVVAALTAAAVAPLLARAQAGATFIDVLTSAYTLRIARFTLLQAGLSTLLSVASAVPLARALAHQPAFPFRATLLRLMALPLGLPALVGVLGIVEVFGQRGWVNRLSEALELGGRIEIYGLTGILLAHVFFNMPLAARMVLAALEAIPHESDRLSAQLGFTPAQHWRHVEWPAVRQILPGAMLLVFMLCAASFTIVLTLGGGPSATTLEVAIYQALRFDFDPGQAVILALLQLALCASCYGVLSRLGIEIDPGATLGARTRPMLLRSGRQTGDWLVIGGAAAFIGLPLVAIVTSGLRAPLASLLAQPTVWQAAATSFAVALMATALAMAAAWSLAAARRDMLRKRHPPGWRRGLDRIGALCAGLTLAMPPIVLGAGWFVLALKFEGPFSIAPAAVVAANALLALPFALRILEPAMLAHARSTDRLALSLGIGAVTRFRLIDWPVLARPLGLSAALAMAMSLGDLGIITLFGSEDFLTLPYLLLQRMGTYRTSDAAGLALILGSFCLTLIWTAEWLARRPRRSAR
ncbi:MAG TPA: thiamine/thiamine pyrophosphate ABC transporter permease [Aestuariivirgaceae bacterium]|nr:thiamine/thiamine pyrophosphate ABC transporter permease [Aestuariivirgaceae bacterium]